MPEAIFESVYAVSSEDPNYPATNLLKHQPGKPWKTKNAGEKSAFVILQMNRSHKIIGIDIGNEHSAFVEVLVGKKACNPDDFKEILITCSFMTPPESKNSINTNRVRCFSKDALVQNVLEEKWDLIKIVCTQPFNRQVKYGLCFIKIHVTPVETNNQLEIKIEDEKKSLVPKQFLNKTILSSPLTEKSSLSSASSVSSFSSNSSIAEPTKRKLIGSFVLREDSPDSESESSLSLFNRWKQSRKLETNSSKVSNAVAIRDASSPSSLQKHHDNLKPTKLVQKVEDDQNRNNVKKKNNVILDRNRDDLFFDKDDEIPNSKLEKKILLDQERIKKEKEERLKNDTKKKRKSDVDEKSKNTPEKSTKTKEKEIDIKKTLTEQNKRRSESKSPRKERNLDNSFQNKKRHSSPTGQSSQSKKIKSEKPREYRPFNKLLQGVVFVISGIQNPGRAEIRQKALEMGAKYKPDWDNTCTHLICAFRNTPKYNQVKGHGKIVTRHWIENCYNLKKRLPWRRYAIDDDEQEKPESEDEIYDISLKPNVECSTTDNDNDNTMINRSKSNSPDTKHTQNKNIKEDHNEKLTVSIINDNDISSDDDESDTEDELERARQLKKLKTTEKSPKELKNSSLNQQQPINSNSSNTIQDTVSSKLNGESKNSTINVYDLSTEEEEDKSTRTNNITNNRIKSNSKKFFNNIKFYVGNVGAVEEIKLKHQIENYGGKIVDDILESDYVITKEPIKISTEFKGEIVKPLWIYECNDMENLIPSKRYRL